MIALYIFLGIIIFFALLMLIPVSLRIGYDENELFVYVKILFVKINLFKKSDVVKSHYPSAYERDADKAEDIDKGETEKNKISDTLRQIKELIAVFVKKAAKHLHIKLEDFQLTVGSDDAAKTALLTGALSGTVIMFFTFLEENTRFRAKKQLYLGVVPDFLCEKTKFKIKLKISALVIELLAILLPTYFSYTKCKPQKRAKNKNK